MSRGITYSPRTIAHASYSAGDGGTIGQIAEALGPRATPDAARAFLRRMQIRAIPRQPGEIVFRVVAQHAVLDTFERVATKHGADPVTLMARVLERLAGPDKSTLLEIVEDMQGAA